EVDQQIAKAEKLIDAEFLKTNIPFKPDTVAARKGKNNRMVVLELFTGVQCPPCVSADIAFDALLKTYKSSDVILLQYHLHIPGPDPLTNKDSEARSKFYGVQGTPTMVLDGKVT